MMVERRTEHLVLPPDVKSAAAAQAGMISASTASNNNNNNHLTSAERRHTRSANFDRPQVEGRELSKRGGGTTRDNAKPAAGSSAVPNPFLLHRQPDGINHEIAREEFQDDERNVPDNIQIDLADGTRLTSPSRKSTSESDRQEPQRSRGPVTQSAKDEAEEYLKKQSPFPALKKRSHPEAVSNKALLEQNEPPASAAAKKPSHTSQDETFYESLLRAQRDLEGSNSSLLEQNHNLRNNLKEIAEGDEKKALVCDEDDRKPAATPRAAASVVPGAAKKSPPSSGTPFLKPAPRGGVEKSVPDEPLPERSWMSTSLSSLPALPPKNVLPSASDAMHSSYPNMYDSTSGERSLYPSLPDIQNLQVSSSAYDRAVTRGIGDGIISGSSSGGGAPGSRDNGKESSTPTTSSIPRSALMEDTPHYMSEDERFAWELARQLEKEEEAQLHESLSLDEKLAVQLSQHDRDEELALELSKQARDEELALELSKQNQAEDEVLAMKLANPVADPEQLKILDRIRKEQEKAFAVDKGSKKADSGIREQQPRSQQGADSADFLISQQLAMEEWQGRQQGRRDPNPPERRRSPGLSLTSAGRGGRGGIVLVSNTRGAATSLVDSHQQYSPSAVHGPGDPRFRSFREYQTTPQNAHEHFAQHNHTRAQIPARASLPGMSEGRTHTPPTREMPNDPQLVPTMSDPYLSSQRRDPLLAGRLQGEPVSERHLPAYPRVEDVVLSGRDQGRRDRLERDSSIPTHVSVPLTRHSQASSVASELTPIDDIRRHSRNRLVHDADRNTEEFRHLNLLQGGNIVRQSSPVPAQTQETTLHIPPQFYTPATQQGLRPPRHPLPLQRTPSEDQRQLMRLGQVETARAVASGQAHVVQCRNCHGRLKAPISYSLVFCPNCHTISPNETMPQGPRSSRGHT